MSRLARSLVVLLTAAVCAASGIAAVAVASPMPLPPPPQTPHDKAAIEPLAADQAQFFCRKTVEPGVKAFEKLVLNHYKGTGSDGDMRGCDVGGSSEHKDGRAWDWGVDHRNAKQRADGKSLLKWLFATDKNGNKDAMFRRLGLMYVIWNKRIWGGWSQSWQPYSCSGVTLCHVNHIHFSFGWAGAEKKTSFWTDRVSRQVEPPLPHLSKLHAHRSLKVTAKSGSTNAMWLFKGHDTYRVVATGVLHHGGKVVADARCAKTADGWQPAGGGGGNFGGGDGGVSIGGDQLQSWGEQWVPVHDSGNGCNTKTHAYRLVMAPAASTTVVGELSGDTADTGSVHLGFTRTG
ncbi:MAG TPA: hypothetical protein VHV79_10915 [Mycobacteriales bacterium]|nr:hypothetical protein [Mycobacteriales bacterium]